MFHDSIVIKGARENNLQNVDLVLPRNKLIVFTGLSGSGKSSLAFDTIYAEGQRRYVESLSSYARQFLGQMKKPDADLIEGLSPAISIDQKGTSSNPRSTVGTVTEIYDYLRLLYARVGIPHCPKCGRTITPQTIDQVVDIVLSQPEGSVVTLLAPVVRGRKGQFQKLFKEIVDKGFTRVRVNGEILRIDTEEIVELPRYVQHNIEVVVDRISVRSSARQRAAESIESAMELSDGTVIILLSDGSEQLLSQHLACTECNISFAELAPRLFSFNSPFGACPKCTGLGFVMEIDPLKVVPKPELSLAEGAIAPWGKPIFSFRYHPGETWFWKQITKFAEDIGLDFDKPWKDLSEDLKNLLLFGSQDSVYADRVPSFEGAVKILERRFVETNSDWAREELTKYMVSNTCPECKGNRLKPEAQAVTVGDINLPKLTSMPVAQLLPWFDDLKLSQVSTVVAEQILKEIKARLNFLNNVGLNYLAINRPSSTLSGGEAQRIRLATQIGSGLVGVVYILDEPSIGLHQRDNRRLLDTLFSLRDMGNTLIVVEHDEETINSADYVVDIGPGAGVNGGKVVAIGTPEEIASSPESITGAYLSKRRKINPPEKLLKPNEKWIELTGCCQNNLQNIDVKFPVGLMTSVTGVSGSGKSTLVNETLYKALVQEQNATSSAGNFKSLKGSQHINKIIVIDQTPIGRTPRSNPATYTGMFDPIRQLFANTSEAKLRGYTQGRFSFNIKGGRCEACQGQGVLKIEMNFLADVTVPCEICNNQRYNRETLEVRYKGKNISEVLDMTVDEALELFVNQQKIASKLQTLKDVGLGYIRLGQAATTLSGGEAQRVKLATELSRRDTGNTLYLLDEPTTGLHFEDVANLLKVLRRLVDAGNTMVVIEHNLDIIRSSDWIIDLGPEGGDKGGCVIAVGSPQKVAKCKESWTGKYLHEYCGL